MTPSLRWPAMTRPSPWRCYDLLLDSLPSDMAPVSLHTGMLWTLARSGGGAGLAAAPDAGCRTTARASDLRSEHPLDLARRVRAWQPVDAGTGLAVINALLNSADSTASTATPLDQRHPGDNPVFSHFADRVAGHTVMVVGRQPGVGDLRQVADVTVLDASPAADELPLAAADYLLPDADWVFLSSASLVDKTFPHLAELAADARLVLTGASTPWLPALREFGVDYLAGARVTDPDRAETIVTEGGGSRVFEAAARYAVLDLGQDEAAQLKSAIAAMFARRARLKAEMEAWYAQGRRRFPGNAELLRVDAELAQLDARYRRVWDAQQAAALASG